MARKIVEKDDRLGDLTCDMLTSSYRVYQRAEGHRFSSDDMVTAFEAHRARPDARRILDLGCGLGSVLLTLAWKIQEAKLVGIEAQDESFELLKRNIEENDASRRVQIHHGDLRDPLVLSRLEKGFDLVTGTPPYFPADAAIDARDGQRARARIEYRGGVEAYLITASETVSPDGVIVVCADARARDRVEEIVSELHLTIHRRCDVIAKEGRPPLFSVWTISRIPRATEIATVTLRDSAGEKTEDAHRLRAFSGFSIAKPSRDQSPKSSF